MRLESPGAGIWAVWHCPSACRLRAVVWVDDETATYYQRELPFRIVGDEVAGRIVKARKITICPGPRIVLIDPLEDDEPAILEDAIAAGIAA